MEKDIKKLVAVFLLISLAKIIFNYFIKSPSTFADSYYYALSAKALIALDFKNFFSFYPPFYPFVISWAYFFSNAELSYFLVKLTNITISSLIIFPAYILAKEYIKDEKIAFFSAIIISLLPSNFAYASFIMSENIFNFLFLTAICFIYFGFKTGKKSILLLASVSVALCYYTRTFGIVLFPIIILFSLIEKKYKEGLFILTLSIILLIPYFIIRGGFLGGYEEYTDRISNGYIQIWEVLFWVIIYPFFVYLQGFIFFTNSAIKSIKNNPTTRLFVISIIGVIILAVYHSMAYRIGFIPYIDGRPIGRYTSTILPLIVILGISNLKKYKISYLLAIPFSILMLFSLLPPNNIDTTWIGIFSIFIENYSILTKIAINFLIAIMVIFSFNYLRKYINLKRVILCLFLSNLVIFGVIAYNSNAYYYSRDDSQAGIYLNKVSPDSIIVIDEEGCTERFVKGSGTLCDEKNKMSLIGFWNKNTIIGNYTQGDYFVSKKELQLKKIKEFGEIKIYET